MASESGEKYRRIALDADGISGADADAALTHLNARFAADDLQIIRDGAAPELWLRQVDLDELRTALDQTADAQPACAALLEEIWRAVTGIRSYGLNGNRRLYVGYNRERKVANRKDKEARRGRHFYARGSDFARDDKPLPDGMRNRILCGDSEELLKQLPANCIDLIFTSPPYNFGLAYAENGNSSDDASEWERYFEKLFRVFAECVRVLKYGGRIIVNVQPLFSDYIPTHHLISNWFMQQGLIWKGEILWEKNNYNCKYTAWGSYASPSSPYLKYTWEFLEIFCKGDLKKTGAATDADISAEDFKKWVVAKWSIAPERRMREFGHPAMFPEELARRALLLFSFRGDTVLDPFAGVGTTCVSALRNQRHYIGIDISAEYCQTARERLATVQPGLGI